ncbi:MAG: ATP-binding protein [Pseudomonadota bacterium]
MDGSAHIASADQSLLAPLLKALDEGVVIVCADGCILAANGQIFTTLNVDPNVDLTGMHVRDTIALHGDLIGLSGDELDREIHIRSKLILGGYHDGGAFSSRRDLRDGRKIEMRRIPMDEGGAIITVRDVTAETSLARKTKQFETVIENTEDGVFQMDGSGRIELFNQRMAQFYRFEDADIRVGDHISKFIRHLLRIAEMDGEALETFLSIDERNSGLDRPLIRNQVIRTTWGNIFEVTRVTLPGGGVMATHRDITQIHERQRLLEVAKFEAEDMSRLKSEFIARVTHELRTPMHGVLGIAALLEQSDLDETQQRFLATLRRSGLHMIDLIDGLLTISTLETGDLILDAQPCDLELILRDSFEMVRPKAVEKGIELDLRLDLDAPEVVADATRLTQVIINLLTNAVKFTDQGTVGLSARAMPANGCSAVTIEVCDTGCGIASDKLEEIFAKFSQIDTGRGARSEGVGLGLSIARSLTELMDGRLSVRSEHGVGTTFSLELGFELAVPEVAEDACGATGRVSPLEPHLRPRSQAPSPSESRAQGGMR